MTARMPVFGPAASCSRPKLCRRWARLISIQTSCWICCACSAALDMQSLFFFRFGKAEIERNKIFRGFKFLEQSGGAAGLSGAAAPQFKIFDHHGSPRIPVVFGELVSPGRRLF